MSKRIVFVLCALAVGAGVALRAQAPATTATATANDAVAALVAEVRALRNDLSQVANASVRSQLLVTRIQLQEQRLMHLDRQRADVAAKLGEAEKMRTMFAAQMKQFENPGVRGPGGATPRHRGHGRSIEGAASGCPGQRGDAARRARHAAERAVDRAVAVERFQQPARRTGTIAAGANTVAGYGYRATDSGYCTRTRSVARGLQPPRPRRRAR